jgi:tRNA A-37 threonylcarbamoyl transferase component Bud32
MTSAQIDAICDQYEQDFAVGRQPEIESVIRQAVATGIPDSLLLELLVLDMELRRSQRNELSLTNYMLRFPDHLHVVQTAAMKARTRDAAALGSAESRTVSDDQFAPPTIPLGSGKYVPSEMEFEVNSGPQLSLPGYSGLEPAGRGALGVVYKARQTETGRVVAIKMIRQELEMDEKSRQLFVREASIMSKLNHPSIVKCLGFGFAGTRPYLVMEFVDSISLESLVWRHDPERRVRLAVKIVMQILEALMYAHQLGVVHRDIKPSNILASRIADKVRLKLTDFGLAKMFETAGQSGITGTGELCGTLAYMSPEQFLDSRSAGPECDVYAVAVCLYRLLTCEYPYPEFAVTDSFRTRLSEEARPVRDMNPHVPENLSVLIHQALLRDFHTRLTSAENLYRSLKQLPVLQSTAKR